MPTDKGFRRHLDVLRTMDDLLGPLRQFQESQRRLMADLHAGLSDHDEWMRSVGFAVRELEKTISSLGPTLKCLDALEFQSPAFDMLNSANALLPVVVEFQREIDATARQTTAMARAWHEWMKDLEELTETYDTVHFAVGSHFARIAEASLTAQRVVSAVSWENIGVAVEATIQEQDAIRRSFLELTESYSALTQSFAEAGRSILSVPPFVTGLPPVEILAAADALSVISHEAPEKTTEEANLAKELAADIEDALDELLTDLDPDLVQTWRGAKAALESDNPDRFRHAAVSLRELVTHVLHKIAPDEEIRLWSSDPSHFSNNRPTRRARILFVCRSINHDPFTSFVEKDVASALELMDLLQKGTHELSTGVSEKQAGVLIIRAQSLLRLLLATAKE
ncbi:MAG: hypothetical protein KAW17_03785 [Candidatus Eisenbacteria sp.]|nr:hypothetical protein [Candidatus Eisenbacteria bacterium]